MVEQELSWDFVEKFYPGPQDSKEILFNKLIKRVLDQDYPEEENDEAYQYLLTEFNGEHFKNLSEIRYLYQSSLIEIYQKTIVNYMNKVHAQLVREEMWGDMEGFV